MKKKIYNFVMRRLWQWSYDVWCWCEDRRPAGGFYESGKKTASAAWLVLCYVLASGFGIVCVLLFVKLFRHAGEVHAWLMDWCCVFRWLVWLQQ